MAGSLRVFRQLKVRIPGGSTEEERNFAIHDLGPGAVVGEENLFTNGIYKYTVQVISRDARMYVYDRSNNVRDFVNLFLSKHLIEAYKEKESMREAHFNGLKSNHPERLLFGVDSKRKVLDGIDHLKTEVKEKFKDEFTQSEVRVLTDQVKRFVLDHRHSTESPKELRKSPRKQPNAPQLFKFFATHEEELRPKIYEILNKNQSQEERSSSPPRKFLQNICTNTNNTIFEKNLKRMINEYNTKQNQTEFEEFDFGYKKNKGRKPHDTEYNSTNFGCILSKLDRGSADKHHQNSRFLTPKGTLLTARKATQHSIESFPNNRESSLPKPTRAEPDKEKTECSIAQRHYLTPSLLFKKKFSEPRRFKITKSFTDRSTMNHLEEQSLPLFTITRESMSNVLEGSLPKE